MTDVNSKLLSTTHGASCVQCLAVIESRTPPGPQDHVVLEHVGKFRLVGQKGIQFFLWDLGEGIVGWGKDGQSISCKK